MAEESGHFGSAGKGISVRKSARGFLRRLLLFLIFFVVLLLILAPRVKDWWGRIYERFAESQAPIVKITKAPSGIGRKKTRLKVRVRDRHSGIDQVTVRIKQGSTRVNLFDKKYDKKKNVDNLSVEFVGSEIGLREGSAAITVTAFDRALWSSSTQKAIELGVDYTAPKLDVLTTQHNATRGGVELVFYRVRAEDSDSVLSGVQVGKSIYPGYPAVELDEDFAPETDLYFAFFAVPLDYKNDNSDIRVFARDKVMNLSYESFFYRVRELRFRSQEEKISREFLEKRIEDLYREYLILESKVSALPPKDFAPAKTEAELLQRFKTVNTDYRALSEKVLQPVLGKPQRKRYWWGLFGRPGGSWLPGVFGDQVNYTFGDIELGSYRRFGMRYSAGNKPEVLSVQDGIVVYADKLGIFGNLMVVDHGFGLSSMYYFLSQMDRFHGDRVMKGDKLGVSGSSGFVDAPRVGFEFRLYGTPIRPEEWWDETWIKGHITNKINRVKKLLGIDVQPEPELKNSQ